MQHYSVLVSRETKQSNYFTVVANSEDEAYDLATKALDLPRALKIIEQGLSDCCDNETLEVEDVTILDLDETEFQLQIFPIEESPL